MESKIYNQKRNLSNNLRKVYWLLFFTLIISLIPFNSYSNNINVSNVTTTGKDTVLHYTMVQFDISWDNSWRTSTYESNWDAAWIFVKWKISSSNVWNHATLNIGGHTAPTGSTIDTPNDGKGVFMYKNANGIGSNNWINARLRWNYGTDGINDNDTIEICLFAIEMVYVPQGTFYVGDGTINNIDGQFQAGSSNTPYQVTSESTITLGGNMAGNLRNNNASGMNPADDFNNTTTQTLPADFPKGIKPYYMMKYEISQKEYVEFINKLTRTQQASRIMTTTVGNYMSDVTTNTSPQYRNGVKLMSDPGGINPRVYGNDLNNNGISGDLDDGQNIVCNYLSWADLTAYLDWVGLRPMTEFEYEKTCRGTLIPIADEYAWGNTTISAVTGIFNNGLTNEIASNSGANCVYNIALLISNGPMRVGSFAQTATNRQQSGGSYYGVMELSGNVWERPVTVGNVTGRTFTGNNGDGNLDNVGDANSTNWPSTNAIGAGFRGGYWFNSAMFTRVNDRYRAALTSIDRYCQSGGRGVRTVSAVPTCTTDTWVATSITSAPIARYGHPAVWTGTEMIVWGGKCCGGSSYYNTGGKYNPVTDTWVATSTTGAPAARYYHTAVWTGTEMIVWGGLNTSFVFFNDGGKYNPTTNTWSTVSLTNAPTGRNVHSAVWTGTEMVIWGGGGNSVNYNTGGRYDPVTNLWVATSTTGAPVARNGHTAVWTGTEMIIWGGGFNTGGKYNPVTDTWVATSTTGAPTARGSNTAVWTGTEMIIWGGWNGTTNYNTGGKYNPLTDYWSATNTTNAPVGRHSFISVWTNCSEMIVWGGVGASGALNTGGRYNTMLDSWTATNLTNAPSGRMDLVAVWTGNEMIIWGGGLNTGGKYTP